MAAAGLGGYVLCGVNDTRRAALARDIVKADCQILLTDARTGACSTVFRFPGCRCSTCPRGSGHNCSRAPRN